MPKKVSSLHALWPRARPRLIRVGIATAAVGTLLGGVNGTSSEKVPSPTSSVLVGKHAYWSKDPFPAPIPNIGSELDFERARRANAGLVVSTDPIEIAHPLRFSSLAAGSIEKDPSLNCLTEAIYYEAAGEPVQGQRAVAQVVLNRTRHPSFPSSVCEVVYQGSDRPTGCQFTFTCDGSLSRAPAQGFWSGARQIAKEALQGRVEPSVGMATHYHTDWVFPYWAPSLSKIGAVGTHIFYRWRGSWGRRQAFRQQPVFAPSSSASSSVTATAVDGIESPDAQQSETDRVASGSQLIAETQEARLPQDPSLSQPARRPLVVDDNVGTLMADDVRPKPRPAKAQIKS